jgi:hypothetical protein
MSQIAMIASPGSVKPDVETLTGDIGGAVGVDAAFNINLLTGVGLTSTGVPASNTITFTIDGYQIGTAQTIGAVTADVVTINLGAVAGTYTIEAKVIGYEATTPASLGYNLICVARTTGAAASIIGVQDKYTAESAAVLGGDANFVAFGNTIIVRVTGVVAFTINWKSVTVSLGV